MYQIAVRRHNSPKVTGVCPLFSTLVLIYAVLHSFGKRTLHWHSLGKLQQPDCSLPLSDTVLQQPNTSIARW